MQDVCQNFAIPVETTPGSIFVSYHMVVICPKCDVALILLEFAGVEVDYCPQCEGLWLDSGEIEHLLKETTGAAHDLIHDFVEQKGSSESGDRAYLCPRCDRPMNEISRPDANGVELLIERCPRGDGLWFDKGELHRLLISAPAEVSVDGAIKVLHDVLGCYFNDSSKGEVEQ